MPHSFLHEQLSTCRRASNGVVELSEMCLALPIVAPLQWPDAPCTQRQERQQGAIHQHWPAPTSQPCSGGQMMLRSACALLCATGSTRPITPRGITVCAHTGGLASIPTQWLQECGCLGAPFGAGVCPRLCCVWGEPCGAGSKPQQSKATATGIKANSLCFLAPREALHCPARACVEKAAVGARAGGTSHRARARQRLSTDEGSRFLFLTKIVFRLEAASRKNAVNFCGILQGISTTRLTRL